MLDIILRSRAYPYAWSSDVTKLYFYPTPLEANSLQEITGFECNDPDDKDPLLTGMKSCYKGNIPIARLRELVDHDDVSDNLTYRCSKCSKCLDCQHSNKFRAMSIQERREQAVIKDSVKLDLIQKRVTVQLPFMKDPVKYLVDKHQGNSNYSQALRIYITQCRKEARILEGMRKAQRELLERGFMVPMNTLNPETAVHQ